MKRLILFNGMILNTEEMINRLNQIFLNGTDMSKVQWETSCYGGFGSQKGIILMDVFFFFFCSMTYWGLISSSMAKQAQ